MPTTKLVACAAPFPLIKTGRNQLHMTARHEKSDARHPQNIVSKIIESD
jgi:hypothetical protein